MLTPGSPKPEDRDRLVQVVDGDSVPVNVATAENQTNGNQKTRSDSLFHTNKVDTTTTAGVIYICEEDKDGVWRFTRINTTTKDFEYATITNNPTMTTYSLAFTNRATLTYQLYAQAF